MIEIDKQTIIDMQLIDFMKVYNKTREGYVAYSAGKTVTPPFMCMDIPNEDGSYRGDYHIKAGYIVGSKHFVVKLSGYFPGNKQKGMSTDGGGVLVFDSQTGQIVSMIKDEGYLTAYRTGVAGAIATKQLARPDSKIVAVLGCGNQARMQIRALMQVMHGITTIHVCGRSMDELEKYVQDMSKEFPKLKIIPFLSFEKGVADADIIYTTTTSSEPILKSEWVKEGTHITAVGACQPGQQELDPAIFGRASMIVADSREMTAQNGEIHYALDGKIIKPSQVMELGEAISKKVTRGKGDITVCDLVGLGFQDAVIADLVCQKYFSRRKIVK